MASSPSDTDGPVLTRNRSRRSAAAPEVGPVLRTVTLLTILSLAALESGCMERGGTRVGPDVDRIRLTPILTTPGGALRVRPPSGAPDVRIEARLSTTTEAGNPAWTPAEPWRAAGAGGWRVRLRHAGHEAGLSVTPHDHAVRITFRFPAGFTARGLTARLSLAGLSRIHDPAAADGLAIVSPADRTRRQHLRSTTRDPAFAPPPFVFAVEAAARWAAVGLGAESGRLDFVGLTVRGRPPELEVEIDFGRPRDLSRPLPALWLHFGSGDAYAALRRHFVRGRRASAGPPGPLWWRQPSFCGRGELKVLASLNGRADAAGDFSTQSVYFDFLRQLAVRRMNAGTVVVEDWWSAEPGRLEPDPKRWPDLRNFVDRCHARSKRVVLRLPLWCGKGLPASWCLGSNGGASAVDPRNPEYLHHLRKRIHYLLSGDGVDADGLKLTGAGNGPWDHANRADRVWGVELLRDYHAAVYAAAKATRPTALVVTRAYHPSFLAFTDMLGVHGDGPFPDDADAAIRHRARLARLLDPTVPVDCEWNSMPNRATWRKTMRDQPTLGVPALSFLTHVDESLEAIRLADWPEIRRVWTAYRARLIE